MWMARDQKEERLQEPGAELGQVTLAGAPVGVALAGERRNVTLCLPGGYHWTPRQGASSGTRAPVRSREQPMPFWIRQFSVIIRGSRP